MKLQKSGTSNTWRKDTHLKIEEPHLFGNNGLQNIIILVNKVLVVLASFTN